MLDNLFYIILPYAAITLAIVITVQRYLKRGFTYSSLSSQFLESDELFYGSVPWHIGILVVLLGHVIGFAIPRQVLWFNGVRRVSTFLRRRGSCLVSWPWSELSV